MRLVPKRTSICLAMIVRDEAHVIERCLNSCLGMMDFIRIIDTGSTDKTPELIQSWAGKVGIDCQILSRPWVDFAHNRNEVLQFAGKCPATHLLLLDADEVLHSTPLQAQRVRAVMETSDKILFTFPMVYGNNICTRTNFVRNLPDRLAYRFPVHEELCLDGDPDAPLTLIRDGADYTDGIYVTTPQDGARTKAGDRLTKDLFALGAAYQEDQNPRHLFYMAQTLRIGAHGTNDPGAWRMVRDIYMEYLRAMAGNYKPHCYVAALWVARVIEMEGAPAEHVLSTYQRVHEMDPGRPEAMGCMAAFCLEKGMKQQAMEYAQKVASCRGSNNYAFLETKWYEKAESILSQMEVSA